MLCLNHASSACLASCMSHSMNEHLLRRYYMYWASIHFSHAFAHSVYCEQVFMYMVWCSGVG